MTIINGLVAYETQAPFYPQSARDNTHGRGVNDIVADYVEFSLRMNANGCLDYIDQCDEFTILFNGTSILDDMICNAANSICRNAVELVYVQFSESQDYYDIRDHTVYLQPPAAFSGNLNTGKVQQALGVDTNYTSSSMAKLLQFSGLQATSFIPISFKISLS